ncbi:hypothetical protein AX16_009947 [Volvariella volvacea WC 439]|nr:hypothetical protein AX16_009947 [Volvariella volvacea WC 439]
MQSLQHDLIPVSNFSVGFSTCEIFKDDRARDERVRYVKLDDKLLGVHRLVKSQRSHNLVHPPKPREEPNDQAGSTSSARATSSNPPPPPLPLPTQAWEAVYPKGSINPGSSIPGGFGFYMSGEEEFRKVLAGANGAGDEAVMSYRVMFEKGWEWRKGGKLPGIFGGVGDSAYGCTGGRKEKRCTCFDVRLMWRANGEGELYTYLPLTDNNRTQQLKVPPYSKQNGDYGFSVGRGAFSFRNAVGSWMSVALRVKMNEVGKEDGELQLWVDGKSVIEVTGLTLREGVDAQAKIKGMHFQTFFGGHEEEWASPKDQKAWFADITGVVVRHG